MFSLDFSMELMKRAKAFGLHQVLHLNVIKGYLNNQKVNWGTHESDILSYRILLK